MMASTILRKSTQIAGRSDNRHKLGHKCGQSRAKGQEPVNPFPEWTLQITSIRKENARIERAPIPENPGHNDGSPKPRSRNASKECPAKGTNTDPASCPAPP
jgi:hypothetical protein